MDKFGVRSDKYIFIGYLKETKRYYFYLADEQNMFVSFRAIFLGKKFLRKGINASKVKLEKVQ